MSYGSSEDVPFLEHVFQQMKYECLVAQSRYAIALLIGEEDSLKLGLLSKQVLKVLTQYLEQKTTKTRVRENFWELILPWLAEILYLVKWSCRRAPFRLLSGKVQSLKLNRVSLKHFSGFQADTKSSLEDPILVPGASGSNFKRLHEALKANIGRFLDLVLPESQKSSQVLKHHAKSVEEILEILCQPKSEEDQESTKLVSTSDSSQADSTTKLFSIQKDDSESGTLEQDDGDAMIDPQDEIITEEQLLKKPSGSISKISADLARTVFVDAKNLGDIPASPSLT